MNMIILSQFVTKIILNNINFIQFDYVHMFINYYCGNNKIFIHMIDTVKIPYKVRLKLSILAIISQNQEWG